MLRDPILPPHLPPPSSHALELSVGAPCATRLRGNDGSPSTSFERLLEGRPGFDSFYSGMDTGACQ